MWYEIMWPSRSYQDLDDKKNIQVPSNLFVMRVYFCFKTFTCKCLLCLWVFASASGMLVISAKQNFLSLTFIISCQFLNVTAWFALSKGYLLDISDKMQRQGMVTCPPAEGNKPKPFLLMTTPGLRRTASFQILITHLQWISICSIEFWGPCVYFNFL